MVNTPAHVGTAAYSRKTLSVRAGMRLSVAVEHPGDLLLTVTEFFPEYYVSGLRKMENCGSMCCLWNISPLLSSR